MNEKHRVGGALLALLLLPVASPTSSSAVPNETAKRHQSVPAVSAVQGSLAIADVTVAKGAARDPVIRQLSQLYELQKLRSEQGEEDSWLISDKTQPDNYVGVVSFGSGKVRRVARFRKWTRDDDSVELAQRLCDLLEKITKERGNQANIVARTTDSGKVTVRGVELVFGDKRVSFNVISRNDPDSKQTEVHLDEVVQ